MIPVNFSISRSAVNYIHQLRDTNTEYQILNVLQREIVARVIGVSLSVLLLTDSAIHMIGAYESLFYAAYRGLIDHKPIDFTSVKKHLKCINIFAQSVLSASVVGLFKPSAASFAAIESYSVRSAFGLLLSRELGARLTLNTANFAHYVHKLSNKLDPEDKKDIQETLDLLDDAEKILGDRNWLNAKTNANPATKKLIELIKNNRSSDSILKEIFARMLCMGLSVAAAIDATLNLLDLILSLVVVLLEKLVFWYDGDWGKITRILINGWNAIPFLLIGALSSSIVGIISPDIGCDLAQPSGEFYNKFRIHATSTFCAVVDRVKNLPEGKSALLPIIVPYDKAQKAQHIVYMLVKKEGEKLSVSIINKGAGSDDAIRTNLDIERPLDHESKIPINITVNHIAQDDWVSYMSLLSVKFSKENQELLEEAKRVASELKKKNPDDNFWDSEDNLNYLIERILTQSLYAITDKGTVAKEAEDLLMCKEQNNGDCPKQSLLGALHYHSWKQSGSSRAYKQYLYNIKKMAYEEDGHILDVALGIPPLKEKPSVLSFQRLKASAEILKSL